MRIVLPPGLPCAAQILAGTPPGGAGMRGAVLVKAAFSLVEDGTGVRRMQPIDDASAAIVTADRLAPGVPPAAATVDDVAYEADLALAKPRSDILVEGFTGGLAQPPGQVTVDGALWFQRAPAPAPTRDLSQNLFGWEPRFTLDGDDTPVLRDPATSARFANVHRRHGAFSTPANRNAAPLPAGAVVRVTRSLDGTGASYAVRLPALVLTARRRDWCGHGPDRPHRWRIVPLGTLAADTLILTPASHRALILWRIGWDWDPASAPRYRSIEIREAA